MKKAVFFDMNETLLNLSLLKKQFEKHFEDAFVLKYWFIKLLHASTVVGAMGDYTNFGELSGATLETLFVESGKELTAETKNEILSAFRHLPAYEDVIVSLKRLKAAGVKTIAVSNSSLAMVKEQLTNAGILDLFDAYYSVDAVKRYKPFKEIYLYVAEQEGLAVDEVVMVATHDWDLYGAKKAGLTTAYVVRKKEIYNPYYLQPDLQAADLIQLTDKILAL